MERRLSAYPLFVKDPYFSIWSNGEKLNESDTMNWFGEVDSLEGVVKIDGKGFCFLGLSKLPRLEQIGLNVTAYKTQYIFRGDDFTFEVDFVSPLPLDDLELLSCPVCYMDYRFISDNKHEIEVALIMHQGWCSNKFNFNHQVRGGCLKLDNLETAWFGLKRQLFLSQTNDATKADWGYFYLAGKKVYYGDSNARESYLNDEFKYSNNKRPDKYIIASSDEKQDTLYIGHDDQIAIIYFDEFLKTYYFRNGKSIFDALIYTKEEHDNINEKLESFDEQLRKEASEVSEEYYDICCASLRQSIAAHKLVENKKGELLFLSKECCSNGCIATVDVTYPSIPLYLKYNPELVKGMILPIFTFARMPIWKYDFAPHDVGTYPNCFGQEYGLIRKNDDIYCDYALKGDDLDTMPQVFQFPSTLDAYDFNMQMPVEECGNMILITYAYCEYVKNYSLAQENVDLLEKWVKYLEEYGLVPDNQLCTDDFAGHVSKNINLSIKATVAIRAYAETMKVLGNEEAYNKYLAISKKFSSFIEEHSDKKGYLPLSYDEEDTMFSLKYNLVFDKLFSFNLFSEKLYLREFEKYQENLNEYGIPLDLRKGYSKTDWQLWIASFANEKLRSDIIKTIARFMKESPSRYPFPDWYDTKTAISIMFKNRTVQGANFFPLLFVDKFQNK